MAENVNSSCTSSSFPSSTSDVFPIVYMDDEESSVASSIREAFMNFGFLYLRGHGVSSSLTNRLRNHLCEFFELPLEKKLESRMKLSKSSSRGYTRLRDETLDPTSSRGDGHEGFYIGRHVEEESEEASKPMRGPNIWPKGMRKEWRIYMEEYIEAMVKVCERLVELIAISLYLPFNYFKPFFTHPTYALRLLHYPPDKHAYPEKGEFAAGAHTDYGMLTVLWTDGNAGLQIKKRGCEEWIDVPHVKDAYVVNIGDMLQRWTNDLYVSTPHRVINVVNVSRFSVPFFYEPNFETWVEALPSCVSPERPRKHSPVCYGEHIQNKYLQTHAEFRENNLRKEEGEDENRL